jgi:heme/copper-type cytochrome/quinol oxidase subunit 2
MSDKQEGALAVAAALLLLFSTMLDPMVTVVLSVVMLLAFTIYKFVKHKRDTEGGN